MPTQQRADDQEDDAVDQASQFPARIDAADPGHGPIVMHWMNDYEIFLRFDHGESNTSR